MSVDYCSYHGQASATWYCGSCDRYFGRCCVYKSDITETRCLLCTRNLQPLGAANLVRPFWNILHKILLYPLKSSSLILLAILAVLSSQLSFSLFGLAIVSFMLLISTRYAYAIIDEAAHGRSNPPGLFILLTVDEDRLFLKQIAVFVIMGAFIGAVRLLESYFLFFLATAFCTFALPASILVLATDRSLFAAINPLSLIRLMTRLGIGYIVLYTFIYLFGSGPVIVTSFVLEYVPNEYLLSINAVTTIYFWFASAYMMGYTLLQYQKELGYWADLDEDDRGQEELSDAEHTLRKITILIIEGRYEEAYDTLKTMTRRAPHELSLQRRLNKLLIALDRLEELQDHSQYLIDKLIEDGMPSIAADVYDNTQKCSPGFQLNNPEPLVQISNVYRDRAQYKKALLLLSELTKRFSDYHDIGSAILQAARIYMENLNQPEKAQPLLRYAVGSDKFDDSIKLQANQLLNMLA